VKSQFITVGEVLYQCVSAIRAVDVPVSAYVYLRSRSDHVTEEGQ